MKPGDCITSIAYEHGHLWQTILNDPANLDLKQAREKYHVLLPGDRVMIPPIRRKEVAAATDMRHNFVLKGATEVFQIRLLNADQTPRSNLEYRLYVDPNSFSGTTNEQGQIKHSIPSDAMHGYLILGSGDDTEILELRLGDLNPKSTTSGAQARLTNLGFDVGSIDGIPGPQTRKAIKQFQRSLKLQKTGVLDDRTLQELEKSHGS